MAWSAFTSPFQVQKARQKQARLRPSCRQVAQPSLPLTLPASVDSLQTHKEKPRSMLQVASEPDEDREVIPALNQQCLAATSMCAYLEGQSRVDLGLR